MKLTIIGASGHGKVVADIAVLNGYTEIEFLDDNDSVKECAGYPVVGNTSKMISGKVFIAVGNANIRKELMEYYCNCQFPVLIHPKAVIARNAEINSGTVVMAGAVINPKARIGKSVIINTNSSVDHDCEIGDYCHVSVGAHLCGNVRVGNSTWIGAGAIVSNNVNISGGCMIGVGAVVIKDIDNPGTYIGVPARKIK